MPLTEIRKRLDSLSKFDLAQEICDIINANSKFLTDLLRQQLSTGLDADKEPVFLIRRGGEFPFYSDRTVFEKTYHGVALGKETDRITFYMTGTFYSSIYVYASGHEFIFDSAVPHYFDIISRNASGLRIMELSKDNIEIFKREILIPQLQAVWRLKTSV